MNTYLTAHIVKTDDGREATNAFLHAPNNELIGVMCEIQPGNNQVISYLDLWLHEPLMASDIDELATVARDHIEREDSEIPFKLQVSGNAIGFGCTLGAFRSSAYKDHFSQLVEGAKRLAANPHHWDKVVPKVALQVTVDREPDNKIVYSLTDESARRLREFHGPGWMPKRIAVDQFDLMDIEVMRGNINAELVHAITDVPLSHIARHGGITFVNGLNNGIVWRYP